jgi:hypothetical protein
MAQPEMIAGTEQEDSPHGSAVQTHNVSFEEITTGENDSKAAAEDDNNNEYAYPNLAISCFHFLELAKFSP